MIEKLFFPAELLGFVCTKGSKIKSLFGQHNLAYLCYHSCWNGSLIMLFRNQPIISVMNCHLSARC